MNAQVLTAQAAQLLDDGQSTEALRLLAQALAIDPSDVSALLLAARGQHACGNAQEARAACAMVLDQDPQHGEALKLLVRLALDDGDASGAQQWLRSALRVRPQDGEAGLLLATTMKSIGRIGDAERILRDVLRNDDAPALAYLALAELGTCGADASLLLRVRERLEVGTLPPKDRVVLHHALGRFYDAAGNVDEAFAQFAAGSAIARSALAYDEASMLSLFDEIMAIFDRAYFDSLPRGRVAEGVTPVFIVGMPRSGSTLIEQVLASHPQVCTEGEAKSFETVLACLKRDRPGWAFYPQFAAHLVEEDLLLLSERVRANTQRQAGSAAILLNKLPGNLVFAGLIHAVLPEARFIAVRRDPRDSCLSCFTTLFAEGVDYSHDLAELGRYARKCEQLMDHWATLLPPDRWREVRYEEFVADPERQARALVDFLGLPWSDACLRFQASGRPVRTASAVQVRQPIHRSSVGRWRRYEGHLQPLLAALADALPNACAPIHHGSRWDGHDDPERTSKSIDYRIERSQASEWARHGCAPAPKFINPTNGAI